MVYHISTTESIVDTQCIMSLPLKEWWGHGVSYLYHWKNGGDMVYHISTTEGIVDTQCIMSLPLKEWWGHGVSYLYHWKNGGDTVYHISTTGRMVGTWCIIYLLLEEWWGFIHVSLLGSAPMLLHYTFRLSLLSHFYLCKGLHYASENLLFLDVSIYCVMCLVA